MEQGEADGRVLFKPEGFTPDTHQPQQHRQQYQRHSAGGEIENNMRASHTLGIRRSTNDGENGGGGSAHIGSDHHSSGGRKTDDTAGGSGEHDGDGRAG